MNLRTFFLLILILSVSGCMPTVISAQNGRELSTSSSRARRAFEDAIHKYNLRDIESAEESFLDAVRFDPAFIEAYIVMGEMYQTADMHAKAIGAFEQALMIDPEFFPNTYYYLASSYMAIGEYESARTRITEFLEIKGISNTMQEQSNQLLQQAEFAIEAVAYPVPFDPVNLGANINGTNDEYSPTLTADEQTLIYTRKKPREDMDYIHLGPYYEDFYVSYRKDGQWSKSVNLGSPINTQNNEGAQSISADGMHLYFTACGRQNGLGSCDIYYARRAGEAWSEPVNLGPPVNSGAWESQPSISPDGKTLYFASNRAGSTGRMDIWVSHQRPNNRWSEPENIGPVINTSGREMSPFIHPDNKTLFFTSDGHPGMGGLDLFYTRKDDQGKWQTPVNLGYPINTFNDEMSLVVGASGKEAYFASEQPGGEGGSDLYFFELYEEARPNPVTYMKGIVFDADNRRRLEARFELIDLVSGEMIVQAGSNPRTGEFLVPIPVMTNLGLNVWRDGYLFFSENFSFDDVRTGVDPHLYDIPLQPIRAGETVVLRNIFFKTDSHELLPESLVELRKLLELLNQNPQMRIEIGGHTDSTGSFVYNQSLSERRALSVYNYLVENGIESNRLAYSGYADQKPIATNETEEGRALNRRTEFKVLGNEP